MDDLIKPEDVDIRVIDQRIGMGIGGLDTVIRLYHKPTTNACPQRPGTARHPSRNLTTCLGGRSAPAF